MKNKAKENPDVCLSFHLSIKFTMKFNKSENNAKNVVDRIWKKRKIASREPNWELCELHLMATPA